LVDPFFFTHLPRVPPVTHTFDKDPPPFTRTSSIHVAPSPFFLQMSCVLFHVEGKVLAPKSPSNTPSLSFARLFPLSKPRVTFCVLLLLVAPLFPGVFRIMGLLFYAPFFFSLTGGMYKRFRKGPTALLSIGQGTGTNGLFSPPSPPPLAFFRFSFFFFFFALVFFCV